MWNETGAYNPSLSYVTKPNPNGISRHPTPISSHRHHNDEFNHHSFPATLPSSTTTSAASVHIVNHRERGRTAQAGDGNADADAWVVIGQSVESLYRFHEDRTTTVRHRDYPSHRRQLLPLPSTKTKQGLLCRSYCCH